MAAWLKFIEAFLEPPGLNILLFVLVLYFWLRAKKVKAAFLLFVNTLLLYSFSVPLVTNQLLVLLEKNYQSSFDDVIKEKSPKAVVVLTFSKWPSANGLLRNQYAAKLAKATNLPILVSGGGKNGTNDDSEAAGMAKSLEADFNISGAIWLESDSNTTMESAKFTKKILDQNSIKDIFLVTNAWHMPRAKEVFSKQGINVVPAPVLSNTNLNKPMLENLTPNADEIVKSGWFFHEYFGQYWYKALELLQKEG